MSAYVPSIDDPWIVLGLQRGATQPEIKQRFRKLALQYHPDRHVRSTEEERQQAETEFKRIGQAWEQLTKSALAENSSIFPADSNDETCSAFSTDTTTSPTFASFATFADYFFHVVRQVDERIRRQQRLPFAATIRELYLGESVEVELPHHRRTCDMCSGQIDTLNVNVKDKFQSACTTFVQSLTSPQGWSSAINLASSGVLMLAYANLTTTTANNTESTGQTVLPHMQATTCAHCMGQGWKLGRAVFLLRIPPHSKPGVEIIFPRQAEHQFTHSNGERGDLVFVLEDATEPYRSTCGVDDGRVGEWTRSTQDPSHLCLSCPISLYEVLYSQHISLKHFDGRILTVQLQMSNERPSSQNTMIKTVVLQDEAMEVSLWLKLPTPSEISRNTSSLHASLLEIRQFKDDNACTER